MLLYLVRCSNQTLWDLWLGMLVCVCVPKHLTSFMPQSINQQDIHFKVYDLYNGKAKSTDLSHSVHT
jgi:hypothetical protein